jgi:hypothetical protein
MLARRRVTRQARRVPGLRALAFAATEGMENVVRRPQDAGAILLSVGLGSGLAMAIAGVMRGVETEVARALPAGSVPPGVDLDAIERILGYGRLALILLEAFHTILFVGLVARVLAGYRRREVGIKRQFGLRWWEVVAEIATEVLAVGLVGVAAGYVAAAHGCRLLVPRLLDPLRAELRTGDALLVGAMTLFASLTIFCFVFTEYADRPTTEQDL